MIDTKTFSKRMQQALKKTGKKQNDLATATGLTPQTISAYCTAKKGPSLENALSISKELGVTVDWLCGAPSDTKRTTAETSPTIKTLADAEQLISVLQRHFYTELTFEQTEDEPIFGLDAEIVDYVPGRNFIVLKIDSIPLSEHFQKGEKLLDLFKGESLGVKIYSDFLSGSRDELRSWEYNAENNDFKKKHHFLELDEDTLPF